MLKNMFTAALLCSALAAPVLAQKSPWSFGVSIANASVAHPFENPPRPGSGSGVNGFYGGIAEKNYGSSRYSLEGVVQYALPRKGQLRLRGGYSLRRTEFTSVYAAADGTPANRNDETETTRGWHLAPGFAALHPLGKFSLHAGVEIPVYFLKRLEWNSTSANLISANEDISEYRRSFPGGVSFGIGPLAGIAFQPAPGWRIGIELRSAWMYTLISGHYEEQASWTQDKPVTGTAETYGSGDLSRLQVALQWQIRL